MKKRFYRVFVGYAGFLAGGLILFSGGAVFAEQLSEPMVQLSNPAAGEVTSVSFSFPSRARFTMFEFIFPESFDLSDAGVARNPAGDYALVVCTRFDEDLQKTYGLAVRDVQFMGQAVRLIFSLEGSGFAGGGTITCGPISGVINPRQPGVTGSFVLRVFNAEGSILQSFDAIPGVMITGDQPADETSSDYTVQAPFISDLPVRQNPLTFLYYFFVFFITVD